MFIRRAVHGLALKFGIAPGFDIEAPPTWVRASPFEWRSVDDRAHIRVLGLRPGGYETLADFEAVWPGVPPLDRRFEEQLSIGAHAIRRQYTTRDERSGTTYDWMEVLTIVDTRPVLFTMRSLPPITPGLIETFDTMIGTYVPDRRFD
jgi:hypothetical protein